MLLAEANTAYLAERFYEAIELLKSILRKNSELFSAWSLLGHIQVDLGDLEKGLLCLMNAAQLKPSQVDIWLECASIHLAHAEDANSEDEKTAHQTKARFLLGRASRFNSDNPELLLKLSSMMVIVGKPRTGITVLKNYLKTFGPDQSIFAAIKQLAIEIEKPHQGPLAYQAAFKWCEAHPEEGHDRMTWQDINDYAELFLQATDQLTGITRVRSFARWKVGRGAQKYWEDYPEDDREWDLEHEPRRIEVPEFDSAQVPLDLYGSALPHLIRTKLAALHLRMGGIHRAEGEVSPSHAGCQTLANE